MTEIYRLLGVAALALFLASAPAISTPASAEEGSSSEMSQPESAAPSSESHPVKRNCHGASPTV